jgi:tRNA (guanosine-2'-O-)-methyltransferase
MHEELISYFSGFLTDNRMEIFNRVLDYRTRHLCIVLEDVFQSQNASATIRSCDCFGIQDLHVIQNKNYLTIDRKVTMGSHKWLTFHHYRNNADNTLQAITNLRKQNYRIIATSPHTRATSPDTFKLENGKAAVFFGTELSGLSDIVLQNADEFLHIPMYGFTQSYNLSVSVALVLQSLTRLLHKSELDWKLTDNERDELLLLWLKKSIKASAQIEARYFSEKNNHNILND